ncbi:hypothetical protein GCM10023063_49040 [Arthrobacter methylotrophus]|uniref:fumarylacetoacetate hydrolase family protein n=1 Tax=Arthrobacter methylotrophus TaxID=121291 RepID=UPI0031EB2D29
MPDRPRPPTLPRYAERTILRSQRRRRLRFRGWQKLDRGGQSLPGLAGKWQQRRATGWHTGAEVPEDSFTFLAPSVPANVFGMAHNTGQPGRDLPAQAFHKAATSVIGPGDAIELASDVGYVDPEAELTVVVGRKVRGLTLDNARTAILGFTIGNDVSARDLQRSDEL